MYASFDVVVLVVASSVGRDSRGAFVLVQCEEDKGKSEKGSKRRGERL